VAVVRLPGDLATRHRLGGPRRTRAEGLDVPWTPDLRLRNSSALVGQVPLTLVVLVRRAVVNTSPMAAAIASSWSLVACW
jgi:hypothetical protein